MVTLQSEIDELDSSDAITLMTVHAAKGLEFPAVVVAGLEEGLFPHRGTRPDDDPEELEEERRLAYVAFTRAQKRLYLSHAGARRVYGRIEPRQRSRFLDEMPAAEIEVLGRPRSGAFRGSLVSREHATPRFERVRAPGPRRPAQAGSHVDPTEANDIDLHLGMRVRHATFGVGEVQAVKPGSPPKVTVIFPGVGPKLIIGRFLEPA
jgi:DNA helicase-2/ATP-dependent DNA helicase PcrA